MAEILGIIGIALLGSVFVATNWLRLVWGQRLSLLLFETALTHLPVLFVVSRISGLDMVQLLVWDGAILAICYVSYCVGMAYTLVERGVAFASPRAEVPSSAQFLFQVAGASFDYAIYRAFLYNRDGATSAKPRS